MIINEFNDSENSQTTLLYVSFMFNYDTRDDDN